MLQLARVLNACQRALYLQSLLPAVPTEHHARQAACFQQDAVVASQLGGQLFQAWIVPDKQHAIELIRQLCKHTK